jgi:hypothetical protein
MDKADFDYSSGAPFVFRRCTRIGEPGMEAFAPFVVTNANIENYVFANFD